MAKYVPDSTSNRWVVISSSRVNRPSDQEPSAPHVCPFCPGNEHQTPPEVYRIGGGEKDTEGWLIRVVPNKYSITDIHEVIIHSPSDDQDIESLPVDQVERILFCYRERYRAHEGQGHVFIFCNHGKEAGASLHHPHSQLVVVPSQITLDSVSVEPVLHVVEETERFMVYCPDFSQWPYEVWIKPKEEGKKYSGSADDQLKELAPLLQKTLQRIITLSSKETFPFPQQNNPFVYNYYISHEANWFLRIIPRFIHRAGFELGTGLSVNVVPPEVAARELRS